MDDDTRISIVIDKIFIERLFYWIIIIVLAVLVVILWMKSPDAAADAQTTTPTATQPSGDAAQPPAQQPLAQPAADAAPPAAKTPSCTNAEKDGTETDIDCGGSCPLKCGTGSACQANADCTSGTCSSNKCAAPGTASATAPAQLSGKVEFDLTNVFVTKTTSSVQVTGIAYKISNGRNETLTTPIIRVYLKSKSGSACLNQRDISDPDCSTAFAEFKAQTLTSGRNATDSHDFSSTEAPRKFVTQGPYWSIGEPFNVVAYLYTQDDQLIDAKNITDMYQVKT